MKLQNAAVNSTVVRFLSKKIRQAYREHGFIGIFIYGVQGVGKSQLALSIAAAAYESWEAALRHTVFSVAELEKVLLTGDRKVCVVWDDAGVFGGRYAPHLRRKLAEYIASVVQVARTRTASLVLTAPSVLDVMKPIRDQPDWLRVELRRGGYYRSWRVAKAQVYGVRTTPIGRPRYYTIIERATFPLAVPDSVYREYMRMRESYVQRTLTYFRDVVEEWGGDVFPVEWKD